jgi:hypothetical protein
MYDKSSHILGNASWDWTGGLVTTLAYKNLSLSAVFDVKVGADLYSMSARSVFTSSFDHYHYIKPRLHYAKYFSSISNFFLNFETLHI